MQIHTDDPEKQAILFANFQAKARAWDDPRREPQLREILGLLRRVVTRGTSELAFVRSEGAAEALPLQRYAGWTADLPEELQSAAASGLLSGPKASLRVYCTVVLGHLILFDGNVKRAATVAEAGSNVQAEFNQANRFARQLKALVKSGRLRNDGKTRRIDLDHLGSFEINDSPND